jgi:heat shock protein HslJ
MSLHRPYRLALVVTALCVAGCARSTPPESPAPEAATAPAVASTPAGLAVAAPTADTATTLVAYQWQLKSATDAAGQSIAALFPGPDNLLGLEFADGNLGVTGGCNRIGMGYQLLEGGQLQLSPGRSTMMACPPPLGDADAAIAKFLTGTVTAALQGDAAAPVLRLAAADGSTLTFSGTPTPETRFGGPGTRAFLEVSPKPCEPAAPPCLMVRDRAFDEQGLQVGEPGEWRALPAGIEGYTPVAGEQHVVRVKRFEQAATDGGAPTVHFVLDLIIQTSTIR